MWTCAVVVLMDLCRAVLSMWTCAVVVLMDLCRGTQEVEAMLGVENDVSCDPLARLRLAIQYDEKKASFYRTTLCC